jgi:hypothetical protein
MGVIGLWTESVQQDTHGGRLFDLSHAILFVTILVALLFIVLLSRDNTKQRRLQAELKSTLATSAGSISGPPEAQVGDIVPAFEGVSLTGKTRGVVYDGHSRYVLFIMSLHCNACLGEMSTWNSIAARIRNQDAIALGMVTDPNTLTVPPLDFELVAIPNMSVQRAYRIVAIPVVMAVSPGGKIEWVHYGTLDSDHSRELLSVIESKPTN